MTSQTSEVISTVVDEDDFDPINDIIDYLIRCAKISFKNAHLNETELHTNDKIQLACNLYKQSPTNFLIQFGKYLAPHHIGYFENLQFGNTFEYEKFHSCVRELKKYHSEESRHRRTRNRRYKALQKLQNETDYFSEKQMMYRNPLLYEQLVGQYLSDEEIHDRDDADNENLTLLNMILETVDHNRMRETKNLQRLQEDLQSSVAAGQQQADNNDNKNTQHFKKQWGDFDTPDTKPSYIPEPRTQSMISAPERKLLYDEFLQEMYNSFIDGRDADIDYHNIDNDEQYDDLKQVSQDAEDRYFDSETNEVENLEEHMSLQKEYGRKHSNDSGTDDSLDVFMKHLVK